MPLEPQQHVRLTPLATYPMVLACSHRRSAPDAGKAAGGQVAEEPEPAGAVLAEVTRKPRISRCPSALTPVASKATRQTIAGMGARSGLPLAPLHGEPENPFP